MKKYKCLICGYIYDESLEKVKFVDLPDDWTCPLCGAPKSSFEEIVEEIKEDESLSVLESDTKKIDHEDIRQLSFGELSSICSNLSRACEKQYLERESELFKDLSEYYKSKVQLEEKGFNELSNLIYEDLENYPIIMNEAKEKNDRGTLRSLTWGEKVTRILGSIINRYDKEGIEFIKNNNIYVCDICGFIYIGNNIPKICPVCKVPSLKIIKMERE